MPEELDKDRLKEAIRLQISEIRQYTITDPQSSVMA